MKVKVLLNKVKVDVSDDFQKAKEYFARHGLPIEWEFEESNISGYRVETVNFGSIGNRFQLTGHQDKITLSKDFITIFVFNGNEFPIVTFPTSKVELLNRGILMTLMTYKEGDVIGETYLTLIHEMMHAVNKLLLLKGVALEDPMDLMFRRGQMLFYWKNDRPEENDSNFGEAWKILTPHLSKLNPVKQRWKYFRPEEKTGSRGTIADLKPDFVDRMDLGREYSGISWFINSGYRTPEYNKQIGGSATSGHITRDSVDVSARNWEEVRKIVEGAMKAGITGITVYTNSPHVHLDMKPLRLEVKVK